MPDTAAEIRATAIERVENYLTIPLDMCEPYRSVFGTEEQRQKNADDRAMMRLIAEQIVDSLGDILPTMTETHRKAIVVFGGDVVREIAPHRRYVTEWRPSEPEPQPEPRKSVDWSIRIGERDDPR